MKRILMGFGVGLTLVAPAAAEYPERPIDFIVHVNAGGLTDVGVRTWAPYMEKCLGNGATIVVQNSPGAGGVIAFSKVASSAPDGYTLGGLNAPNMPLKTVTGDATFTTEDFDYVATMYGSSVSLNVLRTSKYETLQQFIDAAKASSVPLQIGISQVGSDDYVADYKFMQEAGIELQLIPLGDSGSTRNALLGGHVDIVSMSATDAAPYQDTIRTLAVAAEKRTYLLPDVPTFREIGLDVIGGSYHVIGAPKGIPDEASKKLSTCFMQVAQDPAFKEEAKKRSLVLEPMDGETTAERVRAITAEMREVWKKNPW
jgi:tripartite-type tricarboxylate transporter receptor subunit TctC